MGGTPGRGETSLHSEQAGGERAGKRVRFEREDIEQIRVDSSLVKQVGGETVRWLDIAFGAWIDALLGGRPGST